MSRVAFHPPIPRPPDDPTFWLLDGRIGWRPLETTNVDLDAGLTMATDPTTGRRLIEPSGSFGGLALPPTVAVGPEGTIYILDRGTARLARFDPCDCVFLPLPCIGLAAAPSAAPESLEDPLACGTPNAPRPPLDDPRAIGICGGTLFVCDTGNHRVLVYALRGLALRAVWTPPPGATTNPWRPVAIAFDRRTRVVIADAANGVLHRFGRHGTYDGIIANVSAPSSVAIDCDDRIFVLTDEGEPVVRVFAPDGSSLPTPERPRNAASRFGMMPFPIDAAGHLLLGHLCVPSGDPADAAFDLSGARTTAAAPPPLAYLTPSTYVSEPLDSRIYRCQWHRVILRGAIPEGTRVRVTTYTSQTSEPSSTVLSLPDSAWTEAATARAVRGEKWDALVRSTPGRYLWLRLELGGNGRATACLEHVRVEYPRVSLRRYLPSIFGQDPVGAEFTDRFLANFDTTMRSIETTLDHQAALFDPLSTPSEKDADGLDFLTWLASWIGVTLDRQLPEAHRRAIVKGAAKLYPIRGTLTALRAQLHMLLDMGNVLRCCTAPETRDRCAPLPRNCAPEEDDRIAWQPPPLVLEHHKLRRWLFLDHGRLGDRAKLWGQSIVNRSQLDSNARVAGTRLDTTPDPLRDPFLVYAHRFSVFVPACYERSPARRRALENLLGLSRPAHTAYQLEFVEPRFRIGVQSTIGLNSVVGRYPSGVTLDGMPLGYASVLSEPPHQRGGPSLEVGREARVGSTTLLN